MRVIDADALIGALHNVAFEDGTDREIVYRCIELAPTIEERKTGKWIPQYVSKPHWTGFAISCYTCSCCEQYTIPSCRSEYCPHCGAKMEVDYRT